MSQHVANPYELPPEAVQDPPRGLAAMLRRIGPGLIIAAAVVGAGELIATTVLGAESGFTLLWLILLSCAIKVVVQHEIGRYAIGTGETTLEALDQVPGPRAKVSWIVWMWLLMVASLFFSIGGMLGALGEIFSMALPNVPVDVWVPAISGLTLALLYFGRYNLIEKASILMLGIFTAMTVAGAVLVLRRPEFAWLDVLEGLRFRFPEGGLSTALTVFGGTGVGAAELASYPYWCIEKGYARFVGPREDTHAWRNRANGWMRVLTLDVAFSFVLYTFATVAFFFLGAGVLHSLSQTPSGADTIRVLSRMYTDTLGEWSRPLFFAGAIAVLYSTVFAVTAAYSRLVADFLGMLDLYDRHDYAKRMAAIKAMTAVFLIVPCFTFYFVREPVVMVKVAGIAQAILLPAMGFGTLYLIKRRLPPIIRPSAWVLHALWGTSAIMLAVVVISLGLQFLRS